MRGTESVFTQRGVNEGASFSQKYSLTPFGKRFEVMGRLFWMRENIARDPGVIINDLALREAGPRIHDLFQVGERELLPPDDQRFLFHLL